MVMTIQRLTALFTKGQYEEAFAECERLLNTSPDLTDDVLRARAFGYARSGDYENTVFDWEKILAGANANLSDYFQTGFYHLYIPQYAEAIVRFKEVLRIGEETGNDWFKSSVLFYLSYAHMEIGSLEDASRWMNILQDLSEEGGLILPQSSWCTYSQLREEIERRRFSGQKRER